MQQLRADYTEVWVPSAVAPLVQYADRTRQLPNTGIELLEVGDLEVETRLVDALLSFDCIVSWYGTNRPEFREAARKINPCWRFLPALPPPGCALHAIDFHADQLGLPHGMSPFIDTGVLEQKARVIIHPFSGGAAKNWPLEYFQELAKQLPVPVEWIAGPEKDLAGARRFDNLLDLAKYIRASAVYLGNDSGITHLAAATGAPTVALFGGSDATIWSPRGRSVRVIARGRSVRVIEGSNMREIPVPAVLQAVLDTLNEREAIR
jgi:heptosyltransferase-3